VAREEQESHPARVAGTRQSRLALPNKGMKLSGRGGRSGAPHDRAARAAHHAAGADTRSGKPACLRACGSAAAPLGNHSGSEIEMSQEKGVRHLFRHPRVNTRVSLHRGGRPILLGGPSHGAGVLIMAISAR